MLAAPCVTLSYVVSGFSRTKYTRMKHAPADLASVPLAVASRTTILGDYVALTKPRLNGLVVATSAAGYYSARPTRRTCCRWRS